MTSNSQNDSPEPQAGWQDAKKPSQTAGRSYKIFFFILSVFILLIAISLWRWQAAISKKSQQRPPALVVVDTAIASDVPVILNALGQVTPTDTVTIQTQVNGILQRVYFKEGQMIRQGDLIAQIDERPFQAQLMQAQGQLLHDTALLANAKVDLQRYQALWKEDSVSKQVLDTQDSLVRQLEGTVIADQGLVNTAKVNLAYCKITSPINGRLGLRLVDPGNVVQTTNTTGLFVVNNVRPITVVFTLPEDDVPQVVEQLKNKKKLISEAYDRSRSRKLATGILLTIDNQIDPTTGTIKLKSEFQNRDDSLFPNQFVNIKLKVTELKKAITIPTQAILHGAQGDYVYTLTQDKKTVKLTYIKSGLVSGEYTVINDGLKEGEVVVTEGTDKLKDGAQVSIATDKQDQNSTKQSAKVSQGKKA